jgi:hypothetical protein
MLRPTGMAIFVTVGAVASVHAVAGITAAGLGTGAAVGASIATTTITTTTITTTIIITTTTTIGVTSKMVSMQEVELRTGSGGGNLEETATMYWETNFVIASRMSKIGGDGAAAEEASGRLPSIKVRGQECNQ